MNILTSFYNNNNHTIWSELDELPDAFDTAEFERQKGSPEWEDSDWQRTLGQYHYRSLSEQERENMGLGTKWILLCASSWDEGPRYEVYRSKESIKIKLRPRGSSQLGDYIIKVRERRKERDLYPRYFVPQEEIRSIPGIVNRIAQSGLLDSLAPKSDIALSRFVMALAGTYVKYDKSQPTEERLNVHHMNHICCDDRLSNLQVLNQKDHYALERMEFEGLTRQIA